MGESGGFDGIDGFQRASRSWDFASRVATGGNGNSRHRACPGWASGREALASPELFVCSALELGEHGDRSYHPFAQGRFSTTTARIHVGAKTWSAGPARPARARFANDDRVRISPVAA